MLVEEGFNMVSVDASDKMLKYALKSRWVRRKEPAFDQWGTPSFFFGDNIVMSEFVQLTYRELKPVSL